MSARKIPHFGAFLCSYENVRLEFKQSYFQLFYNKWNLKFNWNNIYLLSHNIKVQPLDPTVELYNNRWQMKRNPISIYHSVDLSSVLSRSVISFLGASLLFLPFRPILALCYHFFFSIFLHFGHVLRIQTFYCTYLFKHSNAY